MARTEGNPAIQHKDYESVQYASSDAVSAGEVVVLDAQLGTVGVAAEALAANDTGTYYTKGVFTLPVASGVTVSQFDICFWDVSENKVIITGPASGDPVVGTAVKDGTAAGGYVEVALNESAGPRNIGYAETASGAGSAGTITVTGALTTDRVIPTLISGWTAHTSGGASVSKATVSAANTVSYEVSGTGYAGTDGGIGALVVRDV